MNQGMNLNPYGLNNRQTNFNNNTKTGIATNANGKPLYGNSYSASKNYDNQLEEEPIDKRINEYNKAYHFKTLDPKDMDLNKKQPLESKRSLPIGVIAAILVLVIILLIVII